MLTSKRFWRDCRASTASYRCTSTAAGVSPRTARRATIAIPQTDARSQRSPKRASPTSKRQSTRLGALSTRPWRDITAADRAALLFKVADAIDACRDEFTRIDTLDNGKTLREAEYDVIDAANCFRYYAGLATKPHGQTIDVPAASHTFTLREPIGVCGQIVPWNYPLLMATWKLAPALAAGNVCVLKPSELTPLSAIRLARIFHELEFPRGVVNVVPGAGPTAGHAIASSMLVDKIAFTGGTETGRSIMQAATGNLKKISLELGGKSPMIVFADADFETAVDYALFGIFANTGQICSASSRLVIERSLRDRFLDVSSIVRTRFESATVSIRRRQMGPIISPLHCDTRRVLHSCRH